MRARCEALSFSGRILSLLCAVLLLGCSHEEDQIHRAAPRIVKQVEIDGLRPAATHFIRLFPNGDLLVGGGPTGWLARVSPNGKTKWVFNAVPAESEDVHQVIMSGAAITNNGNIVACGGESENHTGTGLIVVLNSDGEKLNSRALQFNGRTDLNFCDNVDGNVIVTGGTNPAASSVIMMLDDNGAEIWHRIGSVGTLWAPPVIQTSDGSLNAVEYSAANTVVYKFDSGGRVLSQVAVPGTLPFTLINPELMPSVSLVAYQGSATLFKIGEKDDISHSALSNDVGVTVSGSSYLLPDGSVAVFGRALHEHTTAAAARILNGGEIALTQVGPAEQTRTLDDATRISPYTFVATESVTRSPHGVNMLVWLDYPALEKLH